MSETLYVFTLLVIAATCVVIFGARAMVAFQSARTREAREDAYRELAAKAVAIQAEAASTMAAVRAEVSGVSDRLATIEKMLRSVE